MIKLKHTPTGVRISEGCLACEVKPTGIMRPEHLEDAISQLFRKAGISHQVRDHATLEFPVATKLYLEKERRLLTIATECNEEVEMQGSLVSMSMILKAAGVPFEN